MPSVVSWESLSAQIIPCVHQTAAAGRVQAWLPGHGHGRLGGFSILNILDWPNDASVCSLSQVLEKGPIPLRYYLSAKACAGILQRASKRDKTLPAQLERALREVAGALADAKQQLGT